MRYDDIINLEHYKPKNHPRMSIDNRCAQFMPFSALSGYKEAIIETERRVDSKKIVSNDYKEILNNKLLEIKNNLDKSVSITYFKKDTLKDGGKYLKVYGKIKKFDEYKKKIIIENEVIDISDIIDIGIENT